MRKHTHFPVLPRTHQAHCPLRSYGPGAAFDERVCRKKLSEARAKTFATCDILYMYSKQPDDMNCADAPFLCAAANASTQPSIAFTYGPGAPLVESPRIASNLEIIVAHIRCLPVVDLRSESDSWSSRLPKKCGAVPENYRGTR